MQISLQLKQVRLAGLATALLAVVVKGCNGFLNISRRGAAVGQTAARALQPPGPCSGADMT
jgi:hypothetical protein